MIRYWKHCPVIVIDIGTHDVFGFFKYLLNYILRQSNPHEQQPAPQIRHTSSERMLGNFALTDMERQIDTIDTWFFCEADQFVLTAKSKRRGQCVGLFFPLVRSNMAISSAHAGTLSKESKTAAVTWS
jgi:hypothetical protein